MDRFLKAGSTTLSFCLVAAAVTFAPTFPFRDAAASHCGSPPRGSGRSWSHRYARWCRCMGGRYNYSTTRCSGATGAHRRGGRPVDPSEGGRTYDPSKDPWHKRFGRSAELRLIGMRYYRRNPTTVVNLATAIRYFRRALGQHPGNITAHKNLSWAATLYWNMKGKIAYQNRRFGTAAQYFRQAIAYPTNAKDLATNRRNLRAARDMARRAGQSPGPSGRARNCAVCGRAMLRNIRAGLGRTGSIRTYVTQSRAYYANCIRRVRGGCPQSTTYHIYLRALPPCYARTQTVAFYQCVDRAIYRPSR